MRSFWAITILVIVIFVILNCQGRDYPQEGNDEIEKKSQHTHEDKKIDSDLDSDAILMQSNESDIREHRHTIDTEVILPIENPDLMGNESENSKLNQNRSKEPVESDKDHNEKDININNHPQGAEAETAMHKHHPISDALLKRIPDHIHDINNSAETFDYEYIEYVPNHTNTEL